MEGQKQESLKKEPAVRTMKSDIAEFLKKTKPSLISIIAKEAERQEKPQSTEKPRFFNRYLISIVLILVLSGIAYSFYSFIFRKEAPVIVKI